MTGESIGRSIWPLVDLSSLIIHWSIHY
jgi:hypothetical protein